MKIKFKNCGIIGGILSLVLASISSYAVDNLQVSVQATNAILQWKSTNTETYIIQYRSNLNSSYSWQTLTDNYAAASSGFVTYFTHSNSVTYPPPSNNGTNGTVDTNPNDTNSITGATNNFFSTTGFYRVVRDGAYIVGLTNGTVWSGIVTLPVELGNASGNITALSLTENETPVGNSIQTVPAIAPLKLIVDTTQMTNGVHSVSANATWEDTNGGLREADSPPITVTVSNEISYVNWMPTFGELDNSLLVHATSAHLSTDWDIDVYDSDYYYIGTFGGHTDDGEIEAAWDLVGPDGTVYTNSSFFIFYVTTEYADPPTPSTYRVNDPWTATGAWAMAIQHAFDFITDNETLYSELSGFAGAAGSNGGAKPNLDGDGNPYAISFQDAGENSDWANFRTALYNPTTRNLVYFGHGGASGIGYNSSNTNQFIPSVEIGRVLHTLPTGQTNRHAFRFVFLDGCSTAKGNLVDAFGILHKLNVPSIDYLNASMRPSCFCGWDTAKSVGFVSGSALNYDHVNFISHIQFDMLMNSTIGQAFLFATEQPDIGFVSTKDFIIYGCQDVTLGSNNR